MTNPDPHHDPSDDDGWEDVEGNWHTEDCAGDCDDIWEAYGSAEDWEDTEEAHTSQWSLFGPPLLAAAMVGLWCWQAATGRLEMGSPWLLGAGAITFAGVALLAAVTRLAVWASVLLGVYVAGTALLPADAWAGIEAGLLTGGAALLGAYLAGWVGIFTHGTILGHRAAKALAAARAAAEAEDAAEYDNAAAGGVEAVEAYLAKAAPHEAAHTFARMAGRDPQRIIGLWGYAGAGKDTAAAGPIIEHGYTRVSFADKLRAFALAQNPWIRVGYDDPHGDAQYPGGRETRGAAFVRLSVLVETLGWTEAKRIPEVRAFLQATGTDAGRKVLGENVWVDAAMADLPDGPVIITDARFPNEAQAVVAAGGYMVAVERPGVEPVNAHPSETALADWDFDGAVVNEGTPADARHQLLEVIDLLYGTDDTTADAAAVS